MHNRLKQFLAAENVTQAQFATTIGIGKANVSHVLAGRNRPGYDFIKAIMAGYPQLNINWLILGDGKMYVNQYPEKQKPKADPTLLFDNDDFEAAEDMTVLASEDYNDPALDKEMLNNLALTSINSSISPTQHTVKQRNVSKIIVLFDDGSFQEM